MIPGDFSNLIGEFYRVLLLPKVFFPKYLSLLNSNVNFFV